MSYIIWFIGLSLLYLLLYKTKLIEYFIKPKKKGMLFEQMSTEGYKKGMIRYDSKSFKEIIERMSK